MLVPARVVGMEPEHVAKGRGRLGIAVAPAQHDAQSLAQRGVVRAESDGITGCSGGLGPPAAALVRAAARTSRPPRSRARPRPRRVFASFGARASASRYATAASGYLPCS